MATSIKTNGTSNDGGGEDTSNSFLVPPAYDLHRSDRINRGEHNHNDTRPPSSLATTEDSIVSSTVDYQSATSSPGADDDDEQYEGFRRVGGGRIETSIGLAVPPSSTPSANNINHSPDSSQFYHEQQHHTGGDIDDSYYHSNNNDTMTTAAQDVTATIHKMHSKLLYLLSHPELFHEALTWEDHSLSNKFEEDSTFEGLSDTNNNNNSSNSKNNQGSNVMATQNETFEFNPNDVGGAASEADNEQNGDATNTEDEHSPPLPFEIFASDAEVVLPQALTATQLFGVERETGIELEAAAGITGLSHLFLRWLALMPEGDHMNIIRPPGLTVMRIAGGGYRVTAAHRVVWRWMNKFSFVPISQEVEVDAATTSADSSDTTDFDFGDLVTMTIIDVFETDSDGKLLSYCPTFDNRAVHKTKVSVERFKKSATQFKQRMGVIAQSPAGKRVNKAAGRVGRIGMTAALRVGSMVKSKIEEMGTDEMMRRNVAREEEMKMDAMLHSSSNGRDRGREYGGGDDGESSQKLPTRVEV